jgi:hypothetical protein
MRHHLGGPVLAAMILAAAPVAHAQSDLKLPRPSPKAGVSQTIGVTEMSVSYSRPGVKGRAIWGEVVPYGEIWRTGANEATLFTTSDEILVEGRALPAGTYALFTVPTKSSWKVVFNSQADQWSAASHDTAKDVLELDLQPRTVAESAEWMAFSFDNMTVTGGELVLRWERLALPIKIQVSLEKTKKDVSAAMASYDGKSWQTPYRCANFNLEHGLDRAQALSWNKLSVKAEENYFNSRLMALLLAETGDTKGAIEWGEKAIQLGKAAKTPFDTRPVERQVAEWRGK